ncbi:LysR family transcriptional regulator [Neisseriaceae bacterium PsAf]|nr:LysR family transcriptional regulator [Neisseriaceae bacterium PsAf]MCV2503382.1 LysR substrate-binding domain-containing protein [Neisseriaceae bacterium]
MKLQQLRYVLEVYKQNLNVSDAAQVLFTSQPGISKQIRLLEDELGIQIFIRQGKRITAVTEPGKLILETAEKVLREAENIKQIGDELSNKNSGEINLAGVYGFTRCELPEKMCAFKQNYPNVKVSVLPTSSVEIARLVAEYEVDLGIINQNLSFNPELVYLPCNTWSYQLIMPIDHELADKHEIELEDLLKYPLITYDYDFVNQEKIVRVFQKAGLDLPNVTLSSFDADVIKTYVKMGLGIGLIESMAVDLETLDESLEVVSVSHLFSEVETRIIMRKDQYIRGYTYDLINLLNPELTKERIDQLMHEVAVDYVI